MKKRSPLEIDWKKVRSVADRYEKQILSISGVVGISTGILKNSEGVQPCIKIYLSKYLERGKLNEKKIPWELEGISVDVIISGDIIAFED